VVHHEVCFGVLGEGPRQPVHLLFVDGAGGRIQEQEASFFYPDEPVDGSLAVALEEKGIAHHGTIIVVARREVVGLPKIIQDGPELMVYFLNGLVGAAVSGEEISVGGKALSVSENGLEPCADVEPHQALRGRQKVGISYLHDS